MTIESFSCASTPFESFLEKPITTGLPSFSDNEFYDTCITDRAFLFLAELVSPPPSKPPEMILSVCRVIWVTHTSSVFVPFLVEIFYEFGSTLEWLLFLVDPSSSFRYDSNYPLWIKILISLFKWWQSLVW